MPYLRPREGRIVSIAKNGYGTKLTPKMLSLVDMYFSDAGFSQIEAVRLSDYKTAKNVHAQAAELFAHPNIKAEIDRRLKERTAKSEVRADYLINKLMSIVEETKKDNPQAALRGIELLGKSIAFWKDRQEISGPDGEAIKHEQNVKESVATFTSRISQLAERNGTSNIVSLPDGRGEGET